MSDFWNVALDELLIKLQTSRKGLSIPAVPERLLRAGFNRLKSLFKETRTMQLPKIIKLNPLRMIYYNNLPLTAKLCNWPGRNSILQFFFLVVALICFIKRESEVIKSSDSRHFSVQTYTSLIIADQEIPERIIQYFCSDSKWKNKSLIPPHHQNAIVRLTLKNSLQAYNELFNNSEQSYSPCFIILSTLHRQNIWHQSPDDSTDPLIV